jgi:hypothetical protein
MRLWFMAAFAALLFGGPCAAAEIYAGTIGGRQVVLQIGEPREGRVGSYFYRHVGQDLILMGDAIGAEMELTEGVDDGGAQPRRTGYLSLRRDGQTLTGRWRANPRTVGVPVILMRIATTRPVGDPLPEGAPRYLVDTYGEVQVEDTDLMPYWQERNRGNVSGPEQRLGVGAYRMVTDLLTGVAWPVLSQFPDAAAMTRLNSVFEQNRAIAINQALECASSVVAQAATPPRRRPRPETGQVAVTHLGNRLIVFTLSGSIFCGGAHPANYFTAATYDVATASLFDTARLLKLDTPERQAAFTAFWRARLQARLAADPRAVAVECPGITDGEELPVTYRVTPRGLMVMGVNTSSAGAVCNQDLAEISLADLAPYLAPGASDYWN